MTTWRVLRSEVERRLRHAGLDHAKTETRFLVEQASGYDASEWPNAADLHAPARAETGLWQMVERRVAGEPLQYVLGGWAFRGLDLMVDRRVLIPRPETETVVEVALEEAERVGVRRGRGRGPVLSEVPPRAFVVDLGTGSGAIALALEAELPDVEVWATDLSVDALTVARANLAGCGATRVRLAHGSWFHALPPELHGRCALVVSNPPYVAEYEVASLPREVAAFEPRAALVSGPTGLEALDVLLAGAMAWLIAGGALVCEIAPHQAEAVVAQARDVGYVDVFVREDLAGRARVLVARTG